MASDLEIFKHLYFFSLTSYGLITGLADFSFTEQCYWYLQSALNPCLKAAPLSVEKPDFPDFLQILFLSFFLSFFLSTSLRWAIPVLSEPLELVSSQFLALGSRMCNDRVKRKNETFSAYKFYGCDSAWLCGLTQFKILLTCCAWIQLSMVLH